MADQARKAYSVGPPNQSPLKRSPTQKSFFFLNGKLYRTLRQDRASDLLAAWNFETDKVEHFVLSDVKRHMKSAYDTVEVAKLLNRNRVTIQTYVYQGKIKEPVRIYSKGMNSRGQPFTKMKWSEENILDLHTYLLTVGTGRPRKDGVINSGPRIPTRRELLAMMRQQATFYMKTADGEVVPVWSAYNEV